MQDTFLRAWRGYDRFEGRAALRSWLYRIATNVCMDMLNSRSSGERGRWTSGRRGEPVESNLNTLPGGDLDRADPDQPRHRRDRSGGARGPAGHDPPGVRGRAPAPAGAPARGADPVRGPALEGQRGGRAARHERGVGQQRAPARAGDARGARHRADRRRGADGQRPAGAAGALRRGVRALRHRRADLADPRGRDPVDAAVRHVAGGPRGHVRVVVGPGHRLPGLARDPGAGRPTARPRSGSTSRANPAAATTRGRSR